MNTVIKFIKWLREGVVSSLFFCLRGSRTNCTLVRAKAKTIFLLIISAALKLSAKNGQAKIASRNFFGALFAPIFSRPQKWAEKRSEFFGPRWGKKGVQPKLSAGAFYLCTPRSGVKGAKRYSLPKSNRNSC